MAFKRKVVQNQYTTPSKKQTVAQRQAKISSQLENATGRKENLARKAAGLPMNSVSRNRPTIAAGTAGSGIRVNPVNGEFSATNNLALIDKAGATVSPTATPRTLDETGKITTARAPSRTDGGGGSSGSNISVNPATSSESGISVQPATQPTNDPSEFTGGAGTWTEGQNPFQLAAEQANRNIDPMDLMIGGGVQKVGATALAKLAKDKAVKQGLLKLGVNAERIAAGEGLEGLVELALKETKDTISTAGKTTINSKTMRATVRYLKKLAETAKSPKVVLGILLSALSVGEGTAVFSKVMTPNAEGDVVQSINMAQSRALADDDIEAVEFYSDLLNDSLNAMEEATFVFGDWNPLTYVAREKLKVKNAAKIAQQNLLQAQRNQEQKLKEEAYWEETRELQSQRDARFEEQRQQDEIAQQERDEHFQLLEQEKQNAIDVRDEKLAQEWQDRMDEEERKQEELTRSIEERDERLRIQRQKEFQNKIDEFNRQQKSYEEEWERRQKAYLNEKKSNLAFGLLR